MDWEKYKDYKAEDLKNLERQSRERYGQAVEFAQASRFEEAYQQFEESFLMASASLGDVNKVTNNILSDCIDTLVRTNKNAYIDEIIALSYRYLGIELLLGRENTPQVINKIFLLAERLSEQGRRMEAITVYENLLESVKMVYRRDDPILVKCLENITDLYQITDSTSSILITHLEELYDLYQSFYDESELAYAQVVEKLGQVYQDTHRPIEAKRMAEKAQRLYGAYHSKFQ